MGRPGFKSPVSHEAHWVALDQSLSQTHIAHKAVGREKREKTMDIASFLAALVTNVTASILNLLVFKMPKSVLWSLLQQMDTGPLLHRFSLLAVFFFLSENASASSCSSSGRDKMSLCKN